MTLNLFTRRTSIEILANGEVPSIPDAVPLRLGEDLKFSIEALNSYAVTDFEPLVFDAMVLAGGIEFADRFRKRPSEAWGRNLAVSVPVHDLSHWERPEVGASLISALNFLTGDDWHISFRQRRMREPLPLQQQLDLSPDVRATLAYSDGMDSRAVNGIIRATYKSSLVLVRLGAKKGRPKRSQPFMALPYKFSRRIQNAETSARNRGFKFSLVSGLAAYMCGANECIVPESGQGALGPVLVPVGQTYPDYRNHPAFLERMTVFLNALLGTRIVYSFPRLWNTKAETLEAYISLGPESADWQGTISCWKSSKWSSIDGKFQQCGACAACLLRRMSVHAAGQTEPPDTYIAWDLGAAELQDAVNPRFGKLNKAFREYLIAAVLHMEHLADLALPENTALLQRQARILSSAVGLPIMEVETKLARMLSKHADEWNSYVNLLGDRSLVRRWARRN
jgi:7-cyano-7-deazaguanine synthase in queuosine biosynthesis